MQLYRYVDQDERSCVALLHKMTEQSMALIRFDTYPLKITHIKRKHIIKGLSLDEANYLTKLPDQIAKPESVLSLGERLGIQANVKKWIRSKMK